MSGNNFLLSRDFHVTESISHLDMWLSNAFLNQVFYLLTCCFATFRGNLTSGLIEKGQRAYCIVCFPSKIHGQQQQPFKISTSWQVIPVQADLRNLEVPQWDQYTRWWGRGAFSALREQGVYKASSWVKKHTGNILALLKIRHTKNSAVQDNLYEGYWHNFQSHLSHPKLSSVSILENYSYWIYKSGHLGHIFCRA